MFFIDKIAPIEVGFQRTKNGVTTLFKDAKVVVAT